MSAERLARISELRAELRRLLDEEDRENCKDLDAARQECVQMYLAGQKSDSVRRYRNLTGCGLIEAKDAVEAAVALLAPSPQ